MPFSTDAKGKPHSFANPHARFSLRSGDGQLLLSRLKHSLSRHPFNQQIYFIASPGSKRCHSSSAASALKEAVSNKMLLQHMQGSAISWRGPGGSAPCAATATATAPAAAAAATATDANEAGCPMTGDPGGEVNSVAMQNDGTMILKLDRFTTQVIGLDTWMRLPHYMRRRLPPKMRFLKLDLQHPAVLRHQKGFGGKDGLLGEQQPARPPPSRLYMKLQQNLRSLQPVDLLVTTAAPLEAQGNAGTRVKLATEVEQLLRAGGSPDAKCHLVQLHCRIFNYRGGIRDMTEEAAMAAAASMAVDCDDTDVLVIPKLLPPSQMPQRLLIPDWDKLFAAAAAAAPMPFKPTAKHQTTCNVAATLVVRHRSQRRVARGTRDSLSSNTVKREKTNSAASAKQSSESEDASFSSPSVPLCPAYLEALHLLHERQRVAKKVKKKQQRSKETASSLDNEGPPEEAMEMAVPPPFRKLQAAEALFSGLTEYLGCIAMDMPANNEDCAWLREADRTADTEEIHVASVSGGLLHSAAVVSAAQSLSTWVLAEGPGAWIAISVVGVAESPIAYTGQPHGSDLSGESTLHLVLAAEGAGKLRGLLLQTISACDATCSLP